MRIRWSLLPALAWAALSFKIAAADPFHLQGDRNLSWGFQAGVFHTDDELYDATWYRPFMTDVHGSFATGEGRFFNRLELYGLAYIDFARLSYHEKPMRFDDQLSGIHVADLGIEANLTIGIGGRLTLYDGDRFHLHLFGESTFMPLPADVTVHALTVDVNGLQIDVAKPANDHADVSFDWSTESIGLTGAYAFPLCGGRKLVPYLTMGFVRYEAIFRFEADEELAAAFEAFKIDARILEPRTIARTKPYGTVGARYDFSPAWSLDASVLAGPYDGTWIFSASLGVTFRFNFKPPGRLPSMADMPPF